MILTGNEIKKAVSKGDIIIDPFSEEYLEPNSYGFHLNNKLLIYTNNIIDVYGYKNVKEIILQEEGYILEPGKFYLGSTVEKMGGIIYASELYSRLSTSLVGIFIQTSAPLGHTGAIIPWTLEITVAHKVRVYPGMLIGKICFWVNTGNILKYSGRYRNSNDTEYSKLSNDIVLYPELFK